MAELAEFHKRRILATFRHVEKLLNQSLNVLDRPRPALAQPGAADIPPEKVLQIEGRAHSIRARMHGFLERFQLNAPEPSAPASWIVRTNMAAADIALEDLYPHKLKGYGEMNPAAAAELAQTVKDIREQIRTMLEAID